MTRAVSLLMIPLLVGGVRELGAQAARDFVTQGVRAYRALEYEAAAALLRRSLADDVAGTLSPAERAQALSYLGATELFRGQRDSAVDAFRDIVLLDPRYRPDELIFPPEVTNLFQQVRRATKAVVVIVPPVTTLRIRLERFTARVLTSSLADVTVTLARENGTPLRDLYSGPVADSLLVSWDGLTPEGVPPEDGRYVLRVTPRAPGADGLRPQQVALDIKQQPLDTLAWPAPLTTPPLLPERSSAAPAVRSLAVGLAGAAAAMALPSVVAGGREPSTARFAVGATIGLTGVIGFFAHGPARTLEANVRANAPQREAWARRLDAVKAENATRRGAMRLIVRAGPQTVAERGSP